MWNLSYRPEIEDDVCGAATWYDAKRPGLGDIIHFNVDSNNILIVALMGGGRDESSFIHRGR
jgi:hypothetical protein